MRKPLAIALAISLTPLAALAAPAEPAGRGPAPPQGQGGAGPAGASQQRLVPGMAVYTNEVLFGDVWLRTAQLPARERSLITISALIATGKTEQLQGHLGRALGNGVTPVQASGVLTHLALYCGWPSAVSALEVYNQIYTSRNIDFASLQAPMTALPPLASEAARARALTQDFGTIAPKFTQLTNEVVFNDLWRRSDLSVRDRSLVTIAALAAMGDDDLLEPYIRRAVESGWTRDQLTEAMTHLAFYAGFSKATKAMTMIRRTLG